MEVVGLFVIMLVIAAFAFAPLAYFIYMYTMRKGEPFGDIEPHGDSHSVVNDFTENLIGIIKSKLAKK